MRLNLIDQWEINLIDQLSFYKMSPLAYCTKSSAQSLEYHFTDDWNKKSTKITFKLNLSYFRKAIYRST